MVSLHFIKIFSFHACLSTPENLWGRPAPRNRQLLILGSFWLHRTVNRWLQELIWFPHRFIRFSRLVRNECGVFDSDNCLWLSLFRWWLTMVLFPSNFQDLRVTSLECHTKELTIYSKMTTKNKIEGIYLLHKKFFKLINFKLSSFA